MPCYKPIQGYRSLEGVNPETGRIPLTFNPRYALSRTPIPIACGQCVGCKLEYSRQWGIRCVHEIQMHPRSCFLTLTYKPSELPKYGNLQPKHLKIFMKALRRKFGPGIRFFACGEYGDKKGRPHFHVILFNHDFDDKIIWKPRTNDRNVSYRSKDLEKLWKRGHSEIGEANFDSACYIGRYITKKITGKMADQHYEHIDENTGEVIQLRPEFLRMSIMPGIGTEFYEKFYKSIYPIDKINLRGGIILKPPKFYDKKYQKTHPKEFLEIQERRLTEGKKHRGDNTEYRLRIREAIKDKQFNLLVRPIERESNP